MKSAAKDLHDLLLYGLLLADNLNTIKPFNTVLPLTYNLYSACLARGDEEGMEKALHRDISL
jgi:hypothetical protein